MKNERLKKLENELKDLKNWLDLGLVPKKDMAKHQSEIEVIEKKIEEERNRLAYLKESGEQEDYQAPKKSKEPRSALEAHTMPDVGSSEPTDAGLDMETETYDTETTFSEETEEHSEDKTYVEDEEEDPFSDKNRWRRGILEDPDSDSW